MRLAEQTVTMYVITTDFLLLLRANVTVNAFSSSSVLRRTGTSDRAAERYSPSVGRAPDTVYRDRLKTTLHALRYKTAIRLAYLAIRATAFVLTTEKTVVSMNI